MNRLIGLDLPNTTSLDLPPAVHASPREYFEWLDYEILTRFNQGRLAGGMTPCSVGFVWKEPLDSPHSTSAEQSADT